MLSRSCRGTVIGLVSMIAMMSMNQTSANPPSRANLAIVAKPSTSFVSGHERLEAINDGVEPRRSNDTSRGAYGNWPQRGTQWVEYAWPKAVTINSAEVYWYDDGRGVRAPGAAKVQFWDGSGWVDVKDGSVGLKPNAFNAVSFAEITTSRLRLEMTGRNEFSTGVIEWRVFDAGSSPKFPPILDAGPDRVVMVGAKTFLNAVMRSTGQPVDREQLQWTKASGPHAVVFADPHALATSAIFQLPGEYELKLEARADDLASSDSVRVRVQPALSVADISPINTTRHQLTSPFWKPRLKAVIVNWIPHCIAMLDKPDLKEGGINNIIETGKKLAGKSAKPHTGFPWANAYLFNTIESMCLAQAVDAGGDAEIAQAQKAMREKLEQWIPLVLAAQEPDGYFQTRFTLGTPRDNERKTKPARWDARLRGEHEGYVAGYYLEAAIAHHIATDGKDPRLYNAAKRLADCWHTNIGPAPRKPWYDGHQGMERALFRLARFVNQVEGEGKGDKYAQLAKFLLDCRGNPPGSEYDQSHLPVTRQYNAVGHAVRAAYSYAAMADAAKLGDDAEYHSAVHSLWNSLVNRKYYVTGGIGSGETSEGFGHDYSLPNDAYCESCAGCGVVFFQHSTHMLVGHARYADLYEETLYNAVLSDLDLRGENFTYTNSLDTSAARYKWHDCPCCVGNIPRTLLMLPTWTYSTSPDGLYVNLFVGGEVTVPRVAGTDVTVTQKTNYPWDGKVSIVIKPQEERSFKIRLRVPDRSVSEIYSSVPEANGLESVAVNGEVVSPAIENGYVVIERSWKAGDHVDLQLPMKVQRVRAVEQVAATRGRVALRYGPVVYNFEAVDQKLDNVLAPGAPLKAEWTSDLLEGVVTIKGTFSDGSPLLAVPNYARNNRGGRSIVWIRER